MSSTGPIRRPKKAPNVLLRVGLPMMVFMVGGSWFLSTFMQTHMEIKDKHNKPTHIRQFNLEEENRKLLKRLDIDSFSLSRIPRPDEDQAASSNTKTDKAQEGGRK